MCALCNDHHKWDCRKKGRKTLTEFLKCQEVWSRRSSYTWIIRFRAYAQSHLLSTPSAMATNALVVFLPDKDDEYSMYITSIRDKILCWNFNHCVVHPMGYFLCTLWDWDGKSKRLAKPKSITKEIYRRIIFPVRPAVVGGSLLLSSLISCCFSFYLLRTHLFHSILEYLPFPSSAPVWMLCLYVVSALQKILNSHDLHSYQPPFLPFFFQLSFFVVAVVVGTLVSVWNEFIIPARAYENFNAAACVCKQHRKNIFHTMQTTI